MIPEQFPKQIRLLLAGYSSDGTNRKTESNADVYLFMHPTKHSVYVKTFRPNDAPREATLQAESTAVAWLQGKVQVPQLVDYCTDGTTEYMVTTQLPGQPAHSTDATADLPALIALLADGLRQLHALQIADCPLDNRVGTIIRCVKRWFADGVITINELPHCYRKPTMEACIDAIRDSQPAEEELVFAHGDYCLPNVLVADGRLTGFIDLGYAGIADRYIDFVSIDYTIRRNLGSEWVQPFWDAYGVEIDAERFAFYERLHWVV